MQDPNHYFDKIAREILFYERQNAANLQRMIIEPLNRLYTMDIKQAEAKKRDFAVHRHMKQGRQF